MKNRIGVSQRDFEEPKPDQGGRGKTSQPSAFDSLPVFGEMGRPKFLFFGHQKEAVIGVFRRGDLKGEEVRKGVSDVVEPNGHRERF